MTDQLRRDEAEAPLPEADDRIRDRVRLSPRATDAAVAIATLGAAIVNVAAQDSIPISEIPAAGFALLTAATVALMWRRNRSAAVLGIALAVAIVWTLFDYPGNPVFHILVALYAVGRYLPDGVISLGALAATLAVIGVNQVSDGDPVSEVVTALFVVALPWYVGRRVRIRRFYAAAARERAEYLEWKRATEAERAIADARAAIARELHDVVAHNVSVMTVQAGVARLVVAEDPDRAQEAIGAVEDAGRRALDELRHLLGVLRPTTAGGELDPQPALHQIHDLVNQLRQTGMHIALDAEIPPELPVRVDLFAYRIVQEALTNVLKHGGANASVTVRIASAARRLDIEVTNTATGQTTVSGSGQGIVGMRERAMLLGGTFEAGPRPGGGFRVFAGLPIGDP